MSDTTRKFFDSADGSVRCVACHLHPDTCTCGSNAMRTIFRCAGFPVAALTKTEPTT
jgi:hypothetical protein